MFIDDGDIIDGAHRLDSDLNSVLAAIVRGKTKGIGDKHLCIVTQLDLNAKTHRACTGATPSEDTAPFLFLLRRSGTQGVGSTIVGTEVLLAWPANVARSIVGSAARMSACAAVFNGLYAMVKETILATPTKRRVVSNVLGWASGYERELTRHTETHKVGGRTCRVVRFLFPDDGMDYAGEDTGCRMILGLINSSELKKMEQRLLAQVARFDAYADRQHPEFPNTLEQKVNRDKFFRGYRYGWGKGYQQNNAGKRIHELDLTVAADVEDIDGASRAFYESKFNPTVMAALGIDMPDGWVVDQEAFNHYKSSTCGLEMHFDDPKWFALPVFTIRVFSNARLSFNGERNHAEYYLPLVRGGVQVLGTESLAAGTLVDADAIDKGTLAAADLARHKHGLFTGYDVPDPKLLTHPEHGTGAVIVRSMNLTAVAMRLRHIEERLRRSKKGSPKHALLEAELRHLRATFARHGFKTKTAVSREQTRLIKEDREADVEDLSYYPGVM